MKKTILEWFCSVEDEGLRLMLVSNYVNGYIGCLTFESHESIGMAICSGFLWHETPEGYDFWCANTNPDVSILKRPDPATMKLAQKEIKDKQSKP